ncbi:ABC transporter substrate-binding protein [Pseudotabrizicola alkalilacus]|uniref:ABC transporter substrate-binding protein n=1 Tax=Pseudotabrizicola alkalilacus TaxID=2305252 RepID=A0A411YYP0_9RHOB|nr:ABC transporter substrate-binding protein [Pseudotabrizicola alkalilacus]RGP35912.1 ABC transporter substrate-binding protein [Pseudotabrizicola alkalilacus]
MNTVDRRLFMKLAAMTGGALLVRPDFAFAGEIDNLAIAWTTDTATWDPNQRLSPDPQTILKMVFDQPIDQTSDLKLTSGVLSDWALAEDAMSMRVTLRDDVTFSDGTKLTTEDFRYTFFERLNKGEELDLAVGFGTVSDIEILSPTEAVMHFAKPFPIVAQWLSFSASYIVSKAYAEKVGPEGMKTSPMGSGPYVLKEYKRDSRIVLVRRDDYWGELPLIKRITIEIIPDPTARLAALESGTVDLATELSIRDIKRLQQGDAFNAVTNPIARIIYVTIRADGVFADRNIRLAAHHAIDKSLLSKAFFGGDAVTIDQPTIPGMPGFLPDFHFDFDDAKAKELLAASGFGPDNPVSLDFATTNGQFPGDYDIARAIVTMWEKVGIKANLKVITESQWYELNASAKLPPASLFVWENGTGDPELFAGNMFDADLPFATYRTPEVTAMIKPLLSEPDNDKRIKGYEAFNKFLIEEGAMIPLLQAIQTIGYRKGIELKPWANGLIRPHAITS